jgi:hypothetical protein
MTQTTPTQQQTALSTALPTTLPPSLPTPVFENESGLDALFFNTLDQHDNGFNVVVAKTAFHIGPRGANGYATLKAFDPPAPLVPQDCHFDDDFKNSTRQESDLAPYKPMCDVIVVADAHAPGGVAAPQFSVQLLVQTGAQEELLINKHLHVFGPRQFQYQHHEWQLGKPLAITHLPLRYEYAAGGACMVKALDDAANRVPASERLPNTDAATGAMAWQVAQTNPLGLGFCRKWYWQASGIDAIAAPQIDYPLAPYSVSAFNRTMQGEAMSAPAGLGCVGRAWLPRRALAGTVEDKADWQADDIPRLPRDFDFAYWNACPPDQQCRHLSGGELIRLVNLCPQHHPASHVDGHHNQIIDIELPQQACVLLALHQGDVAEGLQIESLVIDTVHIDLHEQKLELTWRICLPCDETISTLRLIHADQPQQLARLAELQQIAAAKAGQKAGH